MVDALLQLRSSENRLTCSRGRVKAVSLQALAAFQLATKLSANRPVCYRMPGLAEGTRQHDWDGLPAALLQQVGSQLNISGLAAGRLTCASWRTGLSLGITLLAPKLHDGKSFKSAARWELLTEVRASIRPHPLRGHISLRGVPVALDMSVPLDQSCGS